jgi:Uma2 family endonuclease
MDDLVTCEKCKRQWDGYAQCPCGIYDSDSDSDIELDKKDNIEEIQKIIMNLQTYLLINNKNLDKEIYGHILNELVKIFNYIS